MVKLYEPNFSQPQKTKTINYRTINTSTYELSKIQENVQQSLDYVTNLLETSASNICLYRQNVSKTIAQNTFFTFDQNVSDAFGLYNSGIFKAPVETIYTLNLLMYITTSANQNHSVLLYKNGTQFMRIWFGENSGTVVSPNTGVQLPLKAGDQLKLYWSSSVASVTFGNSSLIENQFSVRW